MSNYSEALAVAASYCSMAEHCRSEVEDKLRRFELTTDEKSAILNRLQEEGYLNEIRYVKAFVKDKFRFGKWGRIKIRYALRQKGLSNILIEEGLTEIPDDTYREMLTDLLRQKRLSTKANSAYELRNKLLRFAAGRGFELDVAGTCLQKLGLNNEND